MKTFSPSEAAFEGFRLIGRRPGVVAAWALAHLLLAAIVLGLVWLILAPDFPTVIAQIAAAKTAVGVTPADQSWAMPLMIKMRALQWIFQPFGLVFGAVFTCAVYRAINRPQDSGFAYLRLGGDELRLIALGIVYFVLAMVAVIALIIVSAIIGGALYVGLSRGGQNGGWFGLSLVVLGVAVACAAIWIAVRLSLAWPITFAERRIAIFDSWRLTRGAFWRILGTYLLTWIFVLIFSMAVMMVIGVLMLIGTISLGGALKSGEAPDWSRLTPVLGVLAVIWAGTASVITAMSRAVTDAPAMQVYRALSGLGDAGDPVSAPDAPLRPTGALVL
jgi:hypothetical protein